MLHIIYIFFLIQLCQIKTKDYECIIQGNNNPTETSMCTSVATGTQNLCCYTTYKNINGSTTNTCLLADGSTPQTIMDSILNVKRSLQLQNFTDVTMECGTDSETCFNIQNPTNFSSCNITEQEYPFSCCYVETENNKFCYPIDASLNSTTTYFAQTFQTRNNLTKMPYINCSYFDLPTKGNYIVFNFYIILIILYILF